MATLIDPHTVFVAFGSNIGDSIAIIRAAIAYLDRAEGCRVSKVSSCYRSKALGPGIQSDYLNGVLQAATTLTAPEYLEVLQATESIFGRTRELHWGPRTLDLDLLLYDDLVICTKRLELPHPRLAERNFVSQPLLELAPLLVLPDGRALADICRRLGHTDLNRLGNLIDDG